jgi:membrane protease YdiL (CAAX protease family)
MNPQDWARQHRASTFLLLTLTWSWGLWSLLFQYGGQAVLMQGPPAAAFAIAGLGACGPSLAGLAMTAWLDGRPGLAALGRRLRQGALGRWWAALLVAPAVTALVPLVRLAMGQPLDGAALLGLIGPGLALGLSAGLMEEIGWRGVLLPSLLRVTTPLRAALLVGGVWGGLWHGYADYFGVSGEGPVFWALMLLLGPGLLTAWSLLLTIVHLRTGGSLLASVGVHASISSSALVLGQHYDSPAQELGWTLLTVACAWAVVLTLWRHSLPRPGSEPQVGPAPAAQPAA